MDPRVRPCAPRAADREEREPDEAEDDEARDRPVRDLRRQQDVGDEQRDREEVEQAVREDGPEERRARAPAVRQVAAQDGDTRELAGAGRQHRVPEQPDAERGEHLAEAADAARAAPGRIVRRQETTRASTESEVEEDADDRPSAR